MTLEPPSLYVRIPLWESLITSLGSIPRGGITGSESTSALKAAGSLRQRACQQGTPSARSQRRPGRARLTAVPLVPLPKLTLPSDELFAAQTVFKVLPYLSFHWLSLGIWKCRQAGRVLTISYMERPRPLRSGTFGS